MDTFLVGSINGAVVLDTRRPKVIDETILYPVKARMTFNRERIYISLGFDLTEEDFNNLSKSKSKRLTDIKKLISASFDRIKEIVKELHKSEEYSHDKLRNKLKRGRNTYLDIAFDNKISDLKKNGQAGTAASYETAKRFIQRYKTDIRFVEITVPWLEKFEYWALNIEGISETSLGIFLRYVRALFNDTIRSGDLPRGSYPFYSKDTNGYRIPSGTGTKIALTVEQISAIAKLELPERSSIDRCRDMFMLSFHLGGINFKDMLMLKWKNIRNGEVHFIREKTKRKTNNVITVPYTEQAKRIINKWGNSDKSPEAYVIPHLVDGLTPEQILNRVKSFTKQVNDQLKEIGKKKEINILGLSTYVSRHSIATILKNSGAPITFIQETLGHQSSKTTENYLKSFESEQKKKHFEVISKIGEQ